MVTNTDINDDWRKLLRSELNEMYFSELINTLDKEQKTHNIFPLKKDIFNAFNLTPINKVKVIIIGQDPYHGPGQAHGLSFSVPSDQKIPPSLKNIYKELNSDIKLETPLSGDLTRWAKQGVLLLNSTLTVREKFPGSHKKIGWQRFTDKCIEKLSEKKTGLVFLLWGNYAKEKQTLINKNKHLILTAPHPSPFSAYKGFLGCKHFSQTNRYLKQQNLSEISW